MSSVTSKLNNYELEKAQSENIIEIFRNHTWGESIEIPYYLFFIILSYDIEYNCVHAQNNKREVN
jgi:hypothetical protein